MSISKTPKSTPLAVDRRLALAGLMSLPLNACETLDPSILEGILGSGALSQADAAMGIRAALDNGILSALGIVGKDGGFLNDTLIHIPLPKSLQSVQSVMSSIGAGCLLNNLEIQLNRSAETAAPVAKDIFLGAIRDLKIQDAIGIVKGADNAATAYLQDKTTVGLGACSARPWKMRSARRVLCNCLIKWLSQCKTYHLRRNWAPMRNAI